MGMSGGAPYAVCCAVTDDARLNRLGIICGLGPLQRPVDANGMGLPARSFIALARNRPSIAIPLYSKLIGPFMYRYPAWAIAILIAAAPECDRAVFSDVTKRRLHMEAIREGFRRGGAGAAWDLHLYTRPWGFDSKAVKVNSFLWHGELDRTVPAAMGRDYARQLPGCRAEFIPGEGHFSLPEKVIMNVFGSLQASSNK
jgi:pimeloyl-ACP methyl ester carboxylesterase